MSDIAFGTIGAFKVIRKVERYPAVTTCKQCCHLPSSLALS